MNDLELNKLLQAVRVPEQAPEFWERFPRRITAALHWKQQKGEVTLPPRPKRRGVWSWGIAGATILLLLGFVRGYWWGPQPPAALLPNEKLLQEVLATFPNQVRAIIQDENGLHLSLAERPDVMQAQPLWLQICEGKHCRGIITFSGQTVQLGGQQVEVLADAAGEVMLVGPHFFWSSQQSDDTTTARIKAHQLPYTL